METYEHTILQKMYRDFTLDETVLFMKGIISNQSIEIGVLKSEVAEQQFCYNKLKKSIQDAQPVIDPATHAAEVIRSLKEELKAEKLLSKHYKELCLRQYVDLGEG